MQLLRRAISAGANLQTHTPVVSVSESAGDDGRWTVTTPRGAIRAKWVVFASNAYTSAIAPEYKDRIVPVRGTCSHIVTPNPPVNPLLSSYSLRSKSWDYDYLIPRPDGSIVVGGGKSTYLHDLSRWYGNTDDSKLIDLAVGCFNDYMQRHYHGWEHTEAHVDQSWTGSMYISLILDGSMLSRLSHGLHCRLAPACRAHSRKAGTTGDSGVQWARNAPDFPVCKRHRTDDSRRGQLQRYRAATVIADISGSAAAENGCEAGPRRMKAVSSADSGIESLFPATHVCCCSSVSLRGLSLSISHSYSILYIGILLSSISMHSSFVWTLGALDRNET